MSNYPTIRADFPEQVSLNQVCTVFKLIANHTMYALEMINDRSMAVWFENQSAKDNDEVIDGLRSMFEDYSLLLGHTIRTIRLG